MIPVANIFAYKEKQRDQTIGFGPSFACIKKKRPRGSGPFYKEEAGASSESAGNWALRQMLDAPTKSIDIISNQTAGSPAAELLPL